MSKWLNRKEKQEIGNKTERKGKKPKEKERQETAEGKN